MAVIMAGNKLNTKTKGKEDKGRGSKGVTQTNDDSEDAIDFTVLRKPVPTSITGFAQARKIFDLATEELKDLLSNECDLLYECKVCRNIFRSLANFISHKRVYCKDKFSTSVHGHFVQCPSTENEMLQIKQSESHYQEALKAKSANIEKEAENDDMRIPLTKDLTAVYEKIIKIRGVAATETPQVLFKKIPNSNVAMFQNLNFEDKSADTMRAEVQEIDTILSRKKAVLQSNGKFVIEDIDKPNKQPDADNVIQISDDDDDNSSHVLKCKICGLQFSTQKTLKFHMKYKHLESRLVYPCPDCLEIFSTSWSVYRHLFKVHRKTAAQIRRLRESIQSKAFKMNNPPAFYEKRKNIKPSVPQQITEEERRDQENQAWMDNMEGDGEVPRCGGCGRTFERRAALAAHTHTCQPRSRALARPPPPPPPPPPAPAPAPPRQDTKRIEIQIRKDYNKAPPVAAAIDTNDSEKAVEETEAKVDPNDNVNSEDDKDADEAPMEVDDDRSDASDSPEKAKAAMLTDSVKPVIRLPYALQAEKSNLAALKQRVAPDIDVAKLLCKKCDTKLTSPIELYEHVAEHVKWMRYACKLCNYKHYDFEKLPEHVKVVHKLKGDTDFYYSTVKAIDGKEAMIISTCLTESESNGEASSSADGSPASAPAPAPASAPASRRPSRASSDSSRLSDDSGSGPNLPRAPVTVRKRKMQQGRNAAKKKKDANDDGEDQKDSQEREKVGKSILTDGSPSIKAFEENSSDLDDVEERSSKRPAEDASTRSRRPVRKRTKVKNADFEYDLSNLLKMEAQGYRESQQPTAEKPPKAAPVANLKLYQPKKKAQSEPQSKYESLNRDNLGALSILSKKAVEIARAHMRTSAFAVYTVNKSNVFARPMLPRILPKSDKASPKKDVGEDSKDQQKRICKITETLSLKTLETEAKESVCPKEKDPDSQERDVAVPDNVKANKVTKLDPDNLLPDQISKDCARVETVGGTTVPAVLPVKFRRQSLELMKRHPLINQNITDFSKAGMKTKILVIKPIHRDGQKLTNTPLKFQTIKLKDPNKGSSSEDSASDQVMVVKVPKVPCTTASNEKLPPFKVVPRTDDAECTEKKQYEEKYVKILDKEKVETRNEESGDETRKETNGIAENGPIEDSLVEESTNTSDKDNTKTVEVASA